VNTAEDENGYSKRKEKEFIIDTKRKFTMEREKILRRSVK